MSYRNFEKIKHFSILTNIIENQGNKWIDLYLLLTLTYGLVGFISIKSATNTCFFLLLFPSIVFITRSYNYIIENNIINSILPIIITLLLPVLAIFISQLARQEWIIKSYDGPSRMLLSVPILFYFIHKRINFSRLIGVCSPIALFATAIIIYLHPEIVSREHGRFASYFLRPNSFGVYTLVLTCFCLFHMDITLKSSKSFFLYQLCGLLVGLFLVLGSGTRSSWISAVIIFLIWIFLNYRNISTRILISTALFIAVIIPVFLHFFPHSSTRLTQGISQVFSWYYDNNVISSPGIRLSMWKISWKLFLHNPIFGYGDLGYVPYLNTPEIKSIANPRTISVLACCGPHNELLTNTLRSGIFGLVSVLCLFIIPSIYFLKNIFHVNSNIKKAAQLGLAYIICIAINSISIEVFGLRFTSSYYGLIIAGLLAQIISAKLQATRQNLP